MALQILDSILHYDDEIRVEGTREMSCGVWRENLGSGCHWMMTEARWRVDGKGVEVDLELGNDCG